MGGLTEGGLLGRVVLLATPSASTPTQPWSPLQPCRCHPSCGSSRAAPKRAVSALFSEGFREECGTRS